MIPDEILIPFLISIISLDTTHFLQSNFSKTVISCIVIGYIIGDMHLGLLMGIAFQPLWLAIIPVGGTFFPEGEISTMYFLWLLVLAIESGLSLVSLFFPTIVMIFLFGLLGGLFTTINRKLNSRIIILNESKEKYINPAFYVILGLLTHVLFWTFTLYILSRPLLKLMILAADFPVLTLPVKWTTVSLMGLGIAMLVNLGKARQYKSEIILGIALGGMGIWLI